MTVLFELRPAAAAVRHHEVEIVRLEEIGVEAGCVLKPINVVPQHVGRAAAFLVLGGHHLVPESGEERDRGKTRLAEDETHDAAEEEAGRTLLLPHRRGHFLYGLAQRRIGEFREESLHAAQRLGEHLQKPKGANHLLQTGFLIQPERRRCRLETVRVRHELSENHVLHEGETLLVFPLAAKFGDQFACVNAAGAGRSARLAIETERHVLEELLALHEFPFLKLAHQRHAAARRGRLQEGLLVGWAVRQAHAAAHAVDEFYVIHDGLFLNGAWRSPTGPTGRCRRLTRRSSPDSGSLWGRTLP